MPDFSGEFLLFREPSFVVSVDAVFFAFCYSAEGGGHFTELFEDLIDCGEGVVL